MNDMHRAAQDEISTLINTALLKQVSLLSQPDSREGQIASNQYGRLRGGLMDWRRSSVSQAHQSVFHENDHKHSSGVRWRQLQTSRPDLHYLSSLKPHEGKRGPLRIFVLLGGGGLGDALLFSPFIRALKAHFEDCEITLGYAKKIAEEVYRGNPDVSCTIGGDWSLLQGVAEEARWLGVFDLFVDIYCFFPRFLLCNGSRIDLDRHALWLEGSRDLGDIIDRFSSNLGTNLIDKIFKQHFFNVLSMCSGLPLDEWSPLTFSPQRAALSRVDQLALPSLYITIRDGCNPGDMSQVKALGGTRSTKQLAQVTLDKVGEILKASRLKIVQVGDSEDNEIPWADIDLRSKTSLSELCFVMKNSVAHIDTEGGLAHFSRSVNTTAIVCFGPTSGHFFGYPTHKLIMPNSCSCCWYSTHDWVAKCPRATEGPLCTASLDLTTLSTTLSDLVEIKQTPGLKLIRVVDLEEEFQSLETAIKALDLADDVNASGQILLGKIQDDNSSPSPELIWTSHSAQKGGSGMLVKQFRGSSYNIPLNNASVDLTIVNAGSRTPEKVVFSEAARITTQGGVVVFMCEMSLEAENSGMFGVAAQRALAVLGVSRSKATKTIKRAFVFRRMLGDDVVDALSLLRSGEA